MMEGRNIATRERGKITVDVTAARRTGGGDDAAPLLGDPNGVFVKPPLHDANACLAA